MYILISIICFRYLLFVCIFAGFVCDALVVPWKKKNLWVACMFFLLCLVCFKCHCFCWYWIKTKPYSANKAKPFFFQIFMFISKKHLVLYVERLAASLLLCLLHFYASFWLDQLFAFIWFQNFALILPGTNSLSYEKKEFVYFLETVMYECLIFWINMMAWINLVINSMLVWLEIMPGRLY